MAEVIGEDPAGPALAARAVLSWPDVSDHGPGGPGGPGFSSGSVLDTLSPGPVLAAALDDTFTSGLDALEDDELAGVILAARRCESRATAQLLAAVGVLGRRRAASPDLRVAEFIDTELALLLTLTRRAAGTMLGFADGLAQLPATAAALAAGRIHRVQADTIAYETALLDPGLAAAVEQLVLEEAPKLTTTALQRRLRRAVLAADPDAARRRVEEAQRRARVELRDERSGGTAMLAGRDLPTAAALAADQRINHAARELKAAGVGGTLAQLRAAVFLSLLTSTDPTTFLPPVGNPADDPAGNPADDPAANTPTAQPGEATGTQPTTGPAQPEPGGQPAASTPPGTAGREGPTGGPGHRDPAHPKPATSTHPTHSPQPRGSAGTAGGGRPSPGPRPGQETAPGPGSGLGVRER